MGVDSLARRLASAALQKGGVSQDYVDSQLNKKYDKAGGTITGDVAIQGDLTVSGTTTSESQKQLLVEDNVIATNANKVNLQALLSGLAINKNENATYGIMYDPSDDTVKFGEGTLSTDNKFVFKTGEGHPLAIRADSALFTDAHIVKWDAATNSFVDAGTALTTLQEAIDTKRDKLDIGGDYDRVYSQDEQRRETSIIASISHVDPTVNRYSKKSIPLRDDKGNINVSIDMGRPAQRPVSLGGDNDLKANFLQFLHGNSAEWTAHDVPLKNGEIAFLNMPNGRVQLRVGNGRQAFSELKAVGEITVKSSAPSYGVLETGVEYRISTIENGAVEYYFPDTPDADFYAILVFDSGTEAPPEFYTDEECKITGDDTRDGVFAPIAGKHYTVFLWYDGTKQGFVRGVPSEGGTWTSNVPTVGTSTSSKDLKKIVYTAESDIPATPEEGVEYAVVGFVGYSDLYSNLQEKIDNVPTWKTTAPVTDADKKKVQFTKVIISTTDDTNFPGMNGRYAIVPGFTNDGFRYGTVVCSQANPAYEFPFIGSITSEMASGTIVKPSVSPTYINVVNPQVTFSYEYLW